MWCRVQCGAGGGFPDVADEKGKVCVRPISLLMSHIGKTTGWPAGMCPPGPMAAHGHVNGWREAPGWSEAEGFGGHSLSLTDIAIATGVPAKHTTGHTSAGTRSFRRLK